MRIAMVTGEYPPMEGGVGAYTHQLALALVAVGHEVHVLSTHLAGGDRASAYSACEEGLSVERIIRRWDVTGIREARQWLRRLAPDVVNLQYEPAAYGMRGAITFAPTLLRTEAATPLVVTFHDLLPPYLFPKAGPLREWRVRQLARRANGVITTNREDLAQLSQALGKTSPPIRLIPIGSNISASPPTGYSREAWRAEHGFTKDDLVIGFFGFLNRTKGVETLLAALGELAASGRRARLLFIGGRVGTSDATNVRYAEEIDALIETLGLSTHIDWTGFAEPELVSAALLGVDLCALPYCEGANLRHGTLHAALAHGCAIVTTRAPVPTPELEGGKHALLVPPGDPHALVQAISALDADPRLRRRLGAEAKALSSTFTWPSIAADTLAFFEALCSVGPTSRFRAW